MTTAERAREARGHCEIVVQLDGFERAGIEGEVLIWSLDPVTGGWTCSDTLQRRYLPTACRD